MNSEFYVKHRRIVEEQEHRPAFTRFSVYGKLFGGEEVKIGSGFIAGINATENECIYHLLSTMRLKYVN